MASPPHTAAGKGKKKNNKNRRHDPYFTTRQNMAAAEGLTSVDLDGTYIWSNTYDLTSHWLPKPCIDPASAGKAGAAPLDATRPDDAVSTFAPPKDLWEVANPEFTWNVWLSLPFKRIHLANYCVVLARGLCQTLQLSSSGNGTPVFATLITRMRNLNPGSRYQARGLHSQYPGVGNEYECEQILYHKVCNGTGDADAKACRPFGLKYTKSDHNRRSPRNSMDSQAAEHPTYSWSSYCWGRGTVPIMWSQTQKMTDVSPDIVIDDAPYRGVAAYWSRVWERYNTTRFTVINLLKNNCASGVAATLAPAELHCQAEESKQAGKQRGGGKQDNSSRPTSPATRTAAGTFPSERTASGTKTPPLAHQSGTAVETLTRRRLCLSECDNAVSIDANGSFTPSAARDSVAPGDTAPGVLELLAGEGAEVFAAAAAGGEDANAAALARVLNVAEKIDRMVVEASERAARSAHRSHHNLGVDDLLWWDEAPAHTHSGVGFDSHVSHSDPEAEVRSAGKGRTYVLASSMPVEFQARAQPDRSAPRVGGLYRAGDTVHVVRVVEGWLCLAGPLGWLAQADATGTARWLPVRGEKPPAGISAAEHDRALGIEIGYPNYNLQESPQTLMRYMSMMVSHDPGSPPTPMASAAKLRSMHGSVPPVGSPPRLSGSPSCLQEGRSSSSFVIAGDEVIELGEGGEDVFGGVIPLENVDEWSESSSESAGSDSEDGGRPADQTSSPQKHVISPEGVTPQKMRAEQPEVEAAGRPGSPQPQEPQALPAPQDGQAPSTRGTKVLTEAGVAYRGEALLSYMFEQSLHALDRSLARAANPEVEEAQTLHTPGAAPKHHSTQLHHFNWHGLVKRIGEKRTVEGLWGVLDPHLREFGVSSGVLSLEAEDEEGADEPRLVPKLRRDQYQKGVPRFNCADSLDRTNLACFYCSILVLGEQYRVLATADIRSDGGAPPSPAKAFATADSLPSAATPNPSNASGCMPTPAPSSVSDICSGEAWPLNALTHDNALCEIPRHITESVAGTFVENGDVCAIIYCNSPAMHSGLLRGYAGEAKEKQKKSNLSIALSRRYQNQFTDSKRTRALKLFLGRARALIVPYRRLTTTEAAASIIVLSSSVMSAGRIDGETLLAVFGNYGEVKSLWSNPPPLASYSMPVPQVLVLYSSATAARHAANDEPNHRIQVGTAAYGKYMMEFHAALMRTKGRNTKAKVAFNQIKKFALSHFTASSKDEAEKGQGKEKERKEDRDAEKPKGGWGKKLRGLTILGPGKGKE